MSIVAWLGAFFVMLATLVYIITEDPTAFPSMMTEGAFLMLMILSLGGFLREAFDEDYQDDDALERWTKTRARRIKSRVRRRRGGY